MSYTFGIHRSSYKYWLGRPKTPASEHKQLIEKVAAVHEASQGSAGARTIANIVTAEGLRLSRYH